MTETSSSQPKQKKRRSLFTVIQKHFRKSKRSPPSATVSSPPASPGPHVTIHSIPDIVLNPGSYTTLQKAAAHEKQSIHRAPSTSTVASARKSSSDGRPHVTIIEGAGHRHSASGSSMADIVMDNRIYGARHSLSSPETSPKSAKLALPPVDGAIGS